MPFVATHHQQPFAPIDVWWGKQHFELNQSKAWQFGSMCVRMTRLINEWKLEYHRPTIQQDNDQLFKRLDDVHFALPQPIKIERFMFAQTDADIWLMPRLSPRSMVIKPVHPVFIPTGQTTTLYVSTPLWIRGFVQHEQQSLFELPVIRPKETWFGANKQKGELCYATAVDARTSLDLLIPRAFRAVTPVVVQNTSHQQLRFERMNIPVMALPLYYSAETGRLLTSQIRVNYDGREQPRIRIDQKSPAFAGEVELIHQAHNSNTLLNMFDSLF